MTNLNERVTCYIAVDNIWQPESQIYRESLDQEQLHRTLCKQLKFAGTLHYVK